MSDLIVIGFEDEHSAFEMRAELAKFTKGISDQHGRRGGGDQG